MRTRIAFLSAFLLLFAGQMLLAQVSGVVNDASGFPDVGAEVSVKGKDTSTLTDDNGAFTIDAVVGEDVLVIFPSDGGTSWEVSVSSANLGTISNTKSATLDELVVIGYGNTTKLKSSVSSQTIGTEDIVSRPNASVVQRLQGQLAGVNIGTASGQPGANSEILIRGVGSINGDSEPLFIIDGMPVDQDNFRSLNPNEIESITTLKDVGATAIYGNRGANGVILIKTKTGRFNQPLQIDYRAVFGITELQDHDYNLMNAQEQLRLERSLGVGRGAGLTDQEINAAENFDWLDWFFRVGVSTDHTLNLSIGSDKFSSFTSLGYFEQDGILVNSNLQRFNLRQNIRGKSDNEKFDYYANLSLNYSVSDEPNNISTGAVNRNFVLGALQSVPYVTIDDYTSGADLANNVTFVNTPLFLEDLRRTHTRFDEEMRVLANIGAGYEFIPGLKFNTSFGMDFTEEVLTRSEGPTSFNALLFAEDGNNTPGFQDQNSERIVTTQWNNSLNYTKQFGKHGVSLGIFSEYFTAHLREFGFRAEGLNPQTFSPGDGSGFVDDNAANDFFVDQANAQILNNGLFSYFARADYDFDSKYGITGTIRRDASSNFTGDNRWGTFWTVSGRWNISEEGFIKDIAWIDLLKLRASVGTVGNQFINNVSAGNRAYFDSPDLFRSLFATGGGYGGQNAIFLSRIGNQSLRWEEKNSVNIGFDFGFFKQRFTGSVDWYQDDREDLFLSNPISLINGQASLNSNIGELRSTGWDVQIGYQFIRPKVEGGFALGGNFNLGYNESEILSLGGEEEIVTGNGIRRVGRQITEFFVFPYVGVNPANGNALYLDINDNITENPNPATDRRATGLNRFPTMTGGFSLNASYKGFYVDAQASFMTDMHRFDFNLEGFQDPDAIRNFRSTRDLLDAWSPTNTDGALPSLTASNLGVGTSDSDRYLREADFLRLRFVSVGYSFSEKLLEGTGLRRLSVFATAENLFTLTNWRGFDPERPAGTAQNAFPTPRIYSFGVDIGL